MRRSKLVRPFAFDVLEARTLLATVSDGPLVGAVDHDSAKVFVRTDDKVKVAIEYSTSSNLANSTKTPSVKTTKSSDLTAIISLDGLSPETKYYYRILVGGTPQQQSSFPSFRTFARATVERDFEFAVFGDLINVREFPTTGAPAYESAADDDPAFVMQIGDFDHRNPRKISKMRAMHRDVRGPSTAAGADFQQHIADEFPLFHVWDDHDYASNDADKTFPRKADSLRAFKEYYPLPDLPNAAGIWHKFSYAQAEFFMLDLRSQRDPATDANNTNKSMLDGDSIPNGQKAWLKAGLINSTATWKFIITSVPFNPTVEKKDGWAEYPNERTELVNFINSNNITGVILISADMHFGGAIDDGTNSGLPEINIPHTNMNNDRTDTTTRPGTWSEGIVTGLNNPGYGWIRVRDDRVILEAKGADGSVRSSLTVQLGSVGSMTGERPIERSNDPAHDMVLAEGSMELRRRPVGGSLDFFAYRKRRAGHE